MDTIGNTRKTLLSEVIHLYLGCLCQRMGEDDKNGNPSESKLSGISYDGTQNIWWAYFEGDDNCYYYSQIDDVLPILRKLSDMTEEEAYHIAELGTRVAGRENLMLESLDVNSLQAFITVSFFVKGQTVGNGKYKEQIIISQNSAIYSRNFHHWDEKVVPTEGFEITRYLLSKSFDVFGLIESNQAIEKKTEKV